MYKIQNLTSNAKQRQVLVLNNMRIVNSPNMLHQYRNKIPFGLACFSITQREPNLQDDFSNAASTLYILTEAECQAFTEYLSGQV